MRWATAPETSELFRTPLGEKPPPPCKESAFRVCLSDVSQIRAVRWRKATVSSITCQGLRIQFGNFEAWSLPAPSDVHNSWERSAFLREVKSSSPKGDTQPPALSSFPLWKGPGPHGGARVLVSQLSALWKGLPFPLPTRANQENQAGDANCDWFHKHPLPPGVSPASELCASKLSPWGVFFATATELHLCTV